MIFIILFLKLLMAGFIMLVIFSVGKKKKCKCFNLKNLKKNQEVPGTAKDAKIEEFTVHTVKYHLN